MLIVGNGTLITRDSAQPLLPNGGVLVEDTTIRKVDKTDTLRQLFPQAEFVDAAGGLIMPGLINTHMHFYGSFARGMDIKAQSPLEFNQILERLWWRLDKQLTLDDVYFSAAVAMIDCIKNGVTTVFDHHASPGCVRGSLFRLAEAAEDFGLRACLCYEVSDRDGEETAQAGVAENVDFIRACRREGGEMKRGLFGLHASFTLNDRLLRQCAETAGDLATGCHVHVAEAESDVDDCRRRYGMGVVERFRQFGVLSSSGIAAHCVHVDPATEYPILADTGVLVAHNPQSNMGNAVGCAAVPAMFQAGIRLGLGTDGYTCDMMESLKVAQLLHKHQNRNPSVGWNEPHQMLFGENTRFASDTFGVPIGRLVPGAAADLIVVDYQPPTPLLAENINGHLLFGMAGPLVRSTIGNGRVLMRNREILGKDIAAVLARARELASALWQRF